MESNQYMDHWLTVEVLQEHQKMKRSAGSSNIESGPSKPATVQSALPVVLQGQSQRPEQWNVVFIVNVILKMCLPVSLADHGGFRAWLPKSEV
jgi:hypothetical protein